MSSTLGTWVHTSQIAGMQPITTVDTVQNHPFGTIVKARDVSSSAYGEGEFIYVKGVASGAAKAWVGIRAKAGLTILAVASGNYELIGVLMSALDATTKFGWAQIEGRAIGKALTLFADNGVVYFTATAGSVDDASVAGDYVTGAVGRNGSAITAGEFAGEFELQRPRSLRRTAAAG